MKLKAAQKSTARTSKVYLVKISLMRAATVGVVQRSYNKHQAEEYAANFDFDKLGFPILNLRDGIYWILDGQHRIGALKLVGLGNEELMCEVYENLTDAEMAEIFLGRDDRRRIDPFAKFLVACTAQRARETEVRRMVETNGLKISRQKEDRCIGAVSSLLKVYDSAGSIVLGQTLRTIRDAYDADSKAFDGLIIEALGLAFNRYNGRLLEKELIVHLSAMTHGVRGLINRAEAQRLKTGHQKVQCLAAVIVEAYNKHATPRHRVLSWWKVIDQELPPVAAKRVTTTVTGGAEARA
jgi:uncharacterized protein DUF6551